MEAGTMVGAHAVPTGAKMEPKPRTGILKWLLTTDHKLIGVMYMWLSTFFFVLAGAFAMAMRAQLSSPGLHVLRPELYNQIMSLHGTFMVFFWTIPIMAGLSNYVVPLQIGARDMAFPRVNAFSFWLLVPAGCLMLASIWLQGGAAAAGWTSYPPLTDRQYSPGPGVDLWILGLHLAGMSSILGGINFVVTILNLRAPGMTLFKMPLFCWTVLITQSIILVATPVLAGALTMLLTDRLFGTAMTIDAKLKKRRSPGSIPVANMWWPHTKKPIRPIPSVANTMPLYPKTCLPENAGSTWEIIPIPGSTMM